MSTKRTYTMKYKLSVSSGEFTIVDDANDGIRVTDRLLVFDLLGEEGFDCVTRLFGGKTLSLTDTLTVMVELCHNIAWSQEFSEDTRLWARTLGKNIPVLAKDGTLTRDPSQETTE